MISRKSSARRRAPGSANCSVCGNPFRFDETDAPPFCSSRCKMIDLNRWFGEEIGLPHEGGPTKGEATDLDDPDSAGLS